MMDLDRVIESVTAIENVPLSRRHANSGLTMTLRLKMVVQTQIQKQTMREEFYKDVIGVEREEEEEKVESNSTSWI